MDKSQIDIMAYNGEELPENSNCFDEVYWLAMYYLYKVAKIDNIPKEQASAAKKNITKKIEQAQKRSEPNELVVACFNASVKLLTELEKLIQPTAKLKNKSKEELLDIILRFQGILVGLMKNADDDIPQFLRGKKEEA